MRARGGSNRRFLAGPLFFLLGACQSIVGLADWSEGSTGNAGGANPTTSESGTGASNASSTSTMSASVGGAASSSSVSSGSSGGGGGCTTGCSVNCFGAPCDCGTCGAVTVASASATSFFIAASQGRVGVATNIGATGHVGSTLKSSPGPVTDDWTGAPVTALAADAANGYAILGGAVWKVPWGGGATALTTGNGNVSSAVAHVIAFPTTQLCFLNPQSMGGGGGLYCQSTTSAATPLRIGPSDSPVGLAYDGTLVFMAYQGTSASPIMTSTDAAGLQTNIQGVTGPIADVAVDGPTLYWLTPGGMLSTMPKGAGAVVTHGTLLANPKRMKILGKYLYAQSAAAIVRVDKIALGAPEVIADETANGTITDFDVDSEGVYWGVAGVGFRLKGIASL